MHFQSSFPILLLVFPSPSSSAFSISRDLVSPLFSLCNLTQLTPRAPAASWCLESDQPSLTTSTASPLGQATICSCLETAIATTWSHYFHAHSPFRLVPTQLLQPKPDHASVQNQPCTLSFSFLLFLPSLPPFLPFFLRLCLFRLGAVKQGWAKDGRSNRSAQAELLWLPGKSEKRGLETGSGGQPEMSCCHPLLPWLQASW